MEERTKKTRFEQLFRHDRREQECLWPLGRDLAREWNPTIQDV